MKKKPRGFSLVIVYRERRNHLGLIGFKIIQLREKSELKQREDSVI